MSRAGGMFASLVNNASTSSAGTSSPSSGSAASVAAASASSSSPSTPPPTAKEKDWRFSQCFGETANEELTDADILSAVEFDNTGQYLATGDKGGRIVVFDIEKTSTTPAVTTSKSSFTGRSSTTAPKPIEYKFHCEFQSHEPEFDYLKSLEIEEKINQIKWCQPSNNSLFLLSTNDKTVKLWKIFEKQIKTVSTINVEGASTASTGSNSTAASAATSKSSNSAASSASSTSKSAKGAATSSKFANASMLKIPKLAIVESVISCHPRRVFGHAHAYHINSIAVNSDGETFISADDLRINLWHLNHANQSYNILDIKPENMEELTEVITAADYHPSHCNLFIYSSSRGGIKLGDMREHALCDKHSKVFQEPEEAGEKSFYSEIIASISDCKFSRDGRFIISRDYLTVKIWDVKMENKPVSTFGVHDFLRPKLGDLYENDTIFDKFECVISGDGRHIATGSYHNYFHVYDRNTKGDVCLEATNNIPSRKKTISPAKPKIVTDPEQIDYTKKTLHMAWHPKESIIAVCAMNQLYIYNR